jgi:hypothetical protein
MLVKPILDALVKRVGQVVASETPRRHLPPSFIAARIKFLLGKKPVGKTDGTVCAGAYFSVAQRH